MRIPLVFDAADISATTRSRWAKLPPGAKKCAIGIAWTDVDSPTGTLAIEVSTHGLEGVAGAAYPVVIGTHPAGSVGSLLLDNIETAAEFIAVTYTVVSGGVDDVFTDESGVAGRPPALIIKE
jgi:hypothetical protein